MGPKPKDSSSKLTAPPSTSTSPPSPPSFPPISQKYLKDLKVETLLEDQIIVVHVRLFLSLFGKAFQLPISHPESRRAHTVVSSLSPSFLSSQDILTPQECKAFISFFDTLSMTPSPPAKRGEAQRSNGSSSPVSSSPPSLSKDAFFRSPMLTYICSFGVVQAATQPSPQPSQSTFSPPPASPPSSPPGPPSSHQRVEKSKVCTPTFEHTPTLRDNFS